MYGDAAGTLSDAAPQGHPAILNGGTEVANDGLPVAPRYFRGEADISAPAAGPGEIEEVIRLPGLDVPEVLLMDWSS
ncbi:hypothetical protein ONS95_008474 [Cadophora gregata]|uniref:uncharacterized protein n=1 Tax=Cadophora gregata TaxID=51156 RepID=UPI0026DC1F36|nr:uncharacterized protein ONS95_008474 [Cadophora gregata]KAK0100135.1 hypothetical protein ONS95_008474 [Cadophora gregata]